MKHRHLTALWATTAMALTTAANAQDAFDLDKITISGSLTPVETRRSGASVEVLQAEDVQGTGADVITSLNRLPGVNSVSNGGLGASNSIQIRGLPARYVAVRVNGIDVANPSSVQSQFNFGGLTSAGIGRVEVLKGSQSALYGSEAIGGVVDITTYRPEKLGFSGETNVEVGSFGTFIGALSLGYQGTRGEIALTYGVADSEGISARAGDAETDGFYQETLTLSGEYDVTDTVTLGGSVYSRDGSIEIDRSSVDNSGEVFTDELGVKVFADVELGITSHTLSYSYFDVERRDPGGFTRRFEGERHQVAYLGSVAFSDSTTLNFGVDHTEEEFSADAINGSSDTTSFQAELLLSPVNSLDLSAAVRHDEESDFGGKTTGRLAAVWRPVDDIAIRAVAGTGFRAPSLFERFSAFGDPNLQPEESVSFELGVEKTFADYGFIKATYFHTEIDDLIDFDGAATSCGSGFGCYNQVPGTTTAKGVELSGEYMVSEYLTLFGNYTYTDARTDNQRLTRTPKHDLTVGVEGMLAKGLTGSVDLRRVADVEPSPFAPASHKVDDYTLVGMGLAYEVSDNAEAYFRIENLLDEDYETAGGFNTPGRAVFLGVRATF